MRGDHVDSTMPHLQHIYEPGCVYFITSTTYLRLPVLESDAPKLLLIQDFDFYRRKFAYELYLFVVMPDHWHWVIRPSPDDFERFKIGQEQSGGKYSEEPERFYLSKIMEDLQRHHAFAVNQLRAERGLKVWGRGFHDEKIRDASHLRAVAEYIHNNPIKAGLVEGPEDYRFSSYRNIYRGDNSLISTDPIPF